MLQNEQRKLFTLLWGADTAIHANPDSQIQLPAEIPGEAQGAGEVQLRIFYKSWPNPGKHGVGLPYIRTGLPLDNRSTYAHAAPGTFDAGRCSARTRTRNSQLARDKWKTDTYKQQRISRKQARAAVAEVRKKWTRDQKVKMFYGDTV